MATTYTITFTQGGTSNQTIPRSFALSGLSRSTTPEWTSGRADQIASVYVKCSLSIDRNRDVTLNYRLTSGGVTVESGNFVKNMNAGSVYSGSAYLQIGELTASQITAFVNGLSSATLTLNASFSSGATLNLYKKGGVPFYVSVSFVDLEGSSFSLDKTEYTSGDRPVLTIVPMETAGTLAHSVYWTIGSYTSSTQTISGTTATLTALPESFATHITSGISTPLVLHCVTKENGVQLGERTIEVTFTARDMIPTLSVTAAPLDGGTSYWQKFDGCRLSIAANSANSSHKSLTVSGDYTYSGNVVNSIDVPIFQTGGIKTFVLAYTNARDQVATQTVTINVNELKPPVISVFDGQRYESGVDDSGRTIYKWSISSNKVRLKYAFSVDSAGGNIKASDITLTFRSGSNTVNKTTSSMSGSVDYNNTSSTSLDKSVFSSITFASSAEHTITFHVSDGKNTTTASVVIPKSRTNLHIAASDYGVGIGTFVEGTSAENPRFVCEYPAEFRNGIIGLEMEPKIVLDDRDSYNNANNTLIIRDVTVEEAGWYFLQTNFEFGSNANGRRGFEVEVTGEVQSVPIALMLPPVNGDAMRGSAATFVHLYAGDVLHFRTYQTSGTTLAVGVGRRLIKLF